MGEQDRLGRLDVGRARAGRPSPSRSASPTSARSKSTSASSRSIDRPARPEPQVRGDLVVARPAGVELARRPARCARRAPPRGSGGRPRAPGPRRSARRRRPRASAASPATSSATSSSVQEAGPAEAVDVRDRARDVVGRELAVDVDRAREVVDALVVRLAEPTAPEPHRVLPSVSRHATGCIGHGASVGICGGVRGTARAARARRGSMFLPNDNHTATAADRAPWQTGSARADRDASIPADVAPRHLAKCTCAVDREMGRGRPGPAPTSGDRRALGAAEVAAFAATVTARMRSAASSAVRSRCGCASIS